MWWNNRAERDRSTHGCNDGRHRSGYRERAIAGAVACASSTSAYALIGNSVLRSTEPGFPMSPVKGDHRAPRRHCASLQIGAQFVKDSLARHEVEMAAAGVLEKGNVLWRGSSCHGPAREVV